MGKGASQHVFWFCLWRAIAFWSPVPTYVTGLTAIVAFTFNSVLLLLAGAYGFARYNRSSSLFPFYMTFVTFTLGYSIALVYTRYRLPLYPLLEMLAAGTLQIIAGWYSPLAKQMISRVASSRERE